MGVEQYPDGTAVEGAYGYAAGATTGTVTVPAGAKLRRVNVVASSSASATVTIAGGQMITVPAGGYFDEQIPGELVAPAVLIGGSVQAYYVAWTA